jgi:hypothetical protein
LADIQTQLLTLLASWKLLLALTTSPFIIGFAIGHLGRLCAYPLIGIYAGRIEKRAETNAYYMRALAALHKPHISPFYVFMRKFVKGTYESHSEEQVILH